jgi:hypothetical protein
VSGRTIASASHLGKQAADTSQYQSVNRAEGRSGTGSPQHIDLLPQDQNFRLKHNSRPQQADHHSKDQSAQIQHRAAASPNSRSTASWMRFATGTGVAAMKALGREHMAFDQMEQQLHDEGPVADLIGQRRLSYQSVSATRQRDE